MTFVPEKTALAFEFLLCYNLKMTASSYDPDFGAPEILIFRGGQAGVTAYI